MQTARILYTVLQWHPGFSAILGSENQVVSANDEAVLDIFEIQVKEGLVWTVTDQLLRCCDLPCQRPIIAVRSQSLSLEISQGHLGRFPAIKLTHPGPTTIARLKDRSKVAHGPAYLRRDKH